MTYIVEFVAGTTVGQRTSYFATNGISVANYFQNLGLIYEVNSATTPPSTAIISTVMNNSSMPITPLVAQYKDISTTDEYSWWRLATIDVRNYSVPSFKHYLNQVPVDVYIFDSGYTSSHPQFSGVTIDELFTYDGNYTDTTGHGTAVTSIICGKNLSLANVNPKIVKIFGSTTTYLADLLGALDAVIADAGTSVNPKIANMSWVVAKNAYLETQIQKLYAANILVVCAAGNNGTNVSAVTPASMTDVIAVGAYDENMEPVDYTNYSASIIPNTMQETNNGIYEVFAPGTNIVVADTLGEYGLGAGTSLAAAIHTTAVAHTLGNYYSVNAGLQSQIQYTTSRNLAKFTNATNFGLLDITNPWFNGVRNSTCILKSQAPTMNDIIISKNIGVTSGAPFARKLFRTMALNSWSILSGSLPVGVTLTDGWVHGTYTLPGASSQTFNFTVLFDLDGDPTQNVFDFSISVYPT